MSGWLYAARALVLALAVLLGLVGIAFLSVGLLASLARDHDAAGCLQVGGLLLLSAGLIGTAALA
jgi:hypothetical protein